ncbi:MAG: DUF3108 domain-containing protein [Cyclobacteriaceae bacterium]|nr:DUF3108 domain-containing protein [Cyclobacteriaceae bacterium]MCX7636645.1 DUF3108 domain-containing protein [Cyclobacteriaceae bacterium]MDW8330930.1 hypothetical protein [Cyclobacteriaceae bacterium]
MKHVLLFIVAAVFSTTAAAQCNDYYVIKEGSSWTYESFNAKGKSVGKNEQKVTSYQSASNGYKATINSVMYNDKGKKLTEADLEVRCENGTFYMDMRRFIPQDQQKAFESYELKFETENLELPSKLSAGQSLKNGSVTMTAVGSPMPMKITVNITDRKVAGKETITTPAGTFECWKITSRSSTQMQMGINMNLNFTTTEWIAEKTGMVKSESYDRNGNVSSYTVLVSRQN